LEENSPLDTYAAQPRAVNNNGARRFGPSGPRPAQALVTGRTPTEPAILAAPPVRG